MRRYTFGLLVLLGLLGTAPAPVRPDGPPPAATPLASLAVVGDDFVPRDSLVELTADGDITSAVWDVIPWDGVKIHECEDGRQLVFNGPPGRYYVICTGIVDGKLRRARYVVTIGTAPVPPTPVPPQPEPEPQPQPPTPTPPQPTPTPTPPQPTPPTPQTLPLPGLRVVLVCETSQPLTRQQQLVFNSTRLRAYLAQKTTPINGVAGYRVWDKDVETKDVPPTWAQTWNEGRARVLDGLNKGTLKLPAVVIDSDVSDVEVLPMPATEAELLQLLKRYGGE